MWNRKLLKDRAKVVLKVSYLKAFFVSLIIAVTGGEGSKLFNYNFRYNNNHQFQYQFKFNSLFTRNIDVFPYWNVFFIGIFIILVLMVFRIFVGYLVEVGGKHYFVRSAQYDININYLGFSFVKERYFNIVKTMLWRGFLNFLWSLLFIIPGIIKAYSYSMVPYILGDNPNILYNRAVELSIDMTDGEKMDMFVLDLSFIGWYILGSILFGVGVVLVMPYDNATKAELYLVLRKNALDKNLCSYEELGMDKALDNPL